MAPNSTQLPSGSSTIAMVTPGRSSVTGIAIFTPAARHVSTAAAMSFTFNVM